MHRPLLVAVVSSLLGCATIVKPPPTPVPMTPPTSAPGDTGTRGEVMWKDLNGIASARRATYDDWRMKGPTTSLSRGSGGAWTGKLRGVEVTLETEAGKVSGGATSLAITMDDAGAILIEGSWGGRPVKLKLLPEKISGMLPNGPVDLTQMGLGMFNSYQGLLQVSGPSDMPQIAFALLDTMVL